MEVALAASKLPDIEFVNQCVIYDPDTGIFTWRERPREHFPDKRAWRIWNTRYAGKVAGQRHVMCHSEHVYWTLTLNYRRVRAHRIAWLLFYGDDPWPLEIDHIDGVTLDNRISNLRLATSQQQRFNRHGHRDSLSGIIGVSPHGSGYVARIAANGRHIYLGKFPTIEEAAEARRRAAIEFHGEYARHG
jgi:hypothetical protein